MNVHGFYKLTDEYIDIINKNGVYNDRKDRPIYCCIQDKNNKNIYWAIPTSDISHRNPQQMERIKKLCSLPSHDIRSSYYEIGRTTKPAIFKISNVLPITEKYVAGEYLSEGKQLFIHNKILIESIEKKLDRILLTEKLHPNKFEQHITDIYNVLQKELELDHKIEKPLKDIILEAKSKSEQHKNDYKKDIIKKDIEK